VAAQYVVLRAPNATTPGTPVGTAAAGTLTFLDRGFIAAASYQVVAVAADGRRGVSATVSVAGPAPTKAALAGRDSQAPLPTVAARPSPPAAPSPGTTGASGANGGLGYEIVTVGPVVGAVNGGYYQVVNCPSGKKVVGGGFSPNSGQVSWNSSAPSGNSAWAVSGRTESSTPASAFFSAICVVAP
jgi:hypothetical protein